jgi:hypothetical protein
VFVAAEAQNSSELLNKSLVIAYSTTLMAAYPATDLKTWFVEYFLPEYGKKLIVSNERTSAMFLSDHFLGLTYAAVCSSVCIASIGVMIGEQ